MVIIALKSKETFELFRYQLDILRFSVEFIRILRRIGRQTKSSTNFQIIFPP